MRKGIKDFTLEKYREFCQAILEQGYVLFTVRRYLSTESSSSAIILRHDVDRKPGNALRMAQLEHELGVQATYYFRYPYTFKPGVMAEIQSLGHEIGYHYEVLAKTKGDYESAIALFTKELEAFKAICDVRTICMHGSPFSPYDNRDMWEKYNFLDYGVEGEAYLSMAGKGLHYLTDTGRSWNGKSSIRDVMPGAGTIPVETTDELISWIGSAEEDLYVTVHPERWAASEVERVFGTIKDRLMNFGKMIINDLRGI